MKTGELIGPALNWAVAKYEGKGLGALTGEMLTLRISQGVRPPDYSGDWSQGGPIIEREGMLIRPQPGYNLWEAWKHGADEGHFSVGPTPLIAAMRCYVASKLGDEVDIPEELL
jgi:hypothetical protein